MPGLQRARDVHKATAVRAGTRHLLHDALERPVPKRRMPESDATLRAQLRRLLRKQDEAPITHVVTFLQVVSITCFRKPKATTSMPNICRLYRQYLRRDQEQSLTKKKDASVYLRYG